METTSWLTEWFKQQCDGDWEHNYNITISTLDNPGWSFTVDITDTDCEGKQLSIKKFNDDDDWYNVTSDGITFNAVGDASKLLLLIEAFKAFTEPNYG